MDELVSGKMPNAVGDDAAIDGHDV